MLFFAVFLAQSVICAQNFDIVQDGALFLIFWFAKYSLSFVLGFVFTRFYLSSTFFIYLGFNRAFLWRGLFNSITKLYFL